MNDNLLEAKINSLPPITDWQKVFMVLQQANESFLRGATLKELGEQLVGDIEIQGADFYDLPIATSSTPVPLPIPTTSKKFGFLANGKYSQPTGGTLEYTATQWGMTLFDGTKWVKKFTLDMPLPEGTNEIEEGGQLLLNQDGGYKLKSGIDGELSHVIEKTPVTTIVENNGGFNAWGFEVSTFSGYGDDYGPIKNFNKLSFYLKDLQPAELAKVTKLKYQVREVNETGTLLASGEIDIDFTKGKIDYVNVMLPSLIKNDSGVNIWVGYWGNGNVPIAIGRRLHNPTRQIRYKTIGGYNTDFSDSKLTDSPQAYFPFVIFSREEDNITAAKNYADDVMNKGNAIGNIQSGDTKATSGEKVFKEVKKFNDIIKSDFVVDSSEIVGGTTILTANSTFAAWGQLMGKKKDFDALRFPFRPYDTNNIPTYVTMSIRKGSDTGQILVQKTLTGTFLVNTTVDLIFVLDSRFANTAEDDLFVQYHSDGYLAAIGTFGSQTSPLFYTTVKNSSTLDKTTTNTNVLRTEFLKGGTRGTFTPAGAQQIKEISGTVAPAIPSILFPSKVYIYPNSEFNIFNKNVVIPRVGENFNNFSLDYNGNYGKQYKRFFRLSPVGANLNSPLSLSLYKDGLLLDTKTVQLYSANTSTGSGITRKVLIIGDSTVDGSNINIPLKAIFDADSMKVEFAGTRGTTGLKHEGRGGWTHNDYYGPGRVLYVINVSGITTAPSINSVYVQGGVNYTVIEVNMTGGTGYFSVQSAASNRPVDASGTLTKVSGAGDATIVYSSSSTTPTNPLYNPSTQKFDFSYYLPSTSQTMSAGDWVFFQLGINDMFGQDDLTAAATKAATMMTQLKEMIDSIHAYNANIRVGIIITFPPADQDAFAASYNLGQTSEKYTRIGLLTWQKKVLSDLDTTTNFNARTYVIPAHFNLDCEYNFPSENVKPNASYSGSILVNQQTNGVHPNADGYDQIARMYAAIIKYFG
ncbi:MULTISPECIES: SGNH/GDSL hydrolase family protein [Sphingobacterium]|uniref:SGNH/GDSL hydrolase family protein n=1 Tax=Sphingobacterium TaxID=28453 RepID=UPI00257E3D4A|nr:MULTISPECIES: SGNH/GDSL hydrolase family protein [Sphingobacterium]